MAHPLILGVFALLLAPTAYAADEDVSPDAFADEDDDFDDILGEDFGEPSRSSEDGKKKKRPVDEDELDLDGLDMDLDGPSEPGLDDYGDLEELGGFDDLDGPSEPGFDDFGPEEDLSDLSSLDGMDLLDEPTPAELARKEMKPADFGLNLRMVQVLGDNFDAQVVTKGPDAVVVELPVLVAKEQLDYNGEETWLVARFISNGKGAGEQRHLIAAETIAPVSPTVVWFKAHVPVNAAKGEVTVKVYQVFNDGDELSLFSRTVKY